MSLGLLASWLNVGSPPPSVLAPVRWLADHLRQHLPAPLAVVAATVLERAAEVASTPAPNGIAPTPPQMPQAWPEAATFESLLLAPDHRRAATLVDDLLARGVALVDAELHVLQPALYEIGRGWQAGQVSVAQEHLASAIVRSVMVHGLLGAEPRPHNGRRILLACLQGNNHVIGLHMVADAFELGGWAVTDLGGNVSSATLLAQVREWNPDIIGLSVSMPSHLHPVKDAIAFVREALGPGAPPFVLGGMAVNTYEGLAAVVGADAWAPDAAAAVEAAVRLVELRMHDDRSL